MRRIERVAQQHTFGMGRRILDIADHGGPTIDLALAYHPENRSAELHTFLDHFLASKA